MHVEEVYIYIYIYIPAQVRRAGLVYAGICGEVEARAQRARDRTTATGNRREQEWLLLSSKRLKQKSRVYELKINLGAENDKEVREVTGVLGVHKTYGARSLSPVSLKGPEFQEICTFSSISSGSSVQVVP